MAMETHLLYGIINYFYYSSHSITCHPAEVTFLLLPVIAGTRFSDPGGMQGLVDLVG